MVFIVRLPPMTVNPVFTECLPVVSCHDEKRFLIEAQFL